MVKLTFKTTNDLDRYDAWGRIKSMRHYKVSDSSDIAKYEYGYDYASSRTYQEDQVDTSEMDELYGYDTLHRLTAFDRGDLNDTKDAIVDTPDRQQDWTLQVIGNWSAIVSKLSGSDDTPYDTRTHNTVNEITALDPQGAVGSFNLDWGEGASKSGNLYILPDRTDPTNKADRFNYDYRNRLIKAEHTDNYGGQTPTWSTIVTYYYDGLNRRVKKDFPAATDIIFLNDGWQELEEREYDTGDSRWEPRRQFVYGGTYIDEPLIFDKDTDNDGDCTDAGGSSRYFYAQQANWNVVAVTGSDGTIVEKIKYDPYGQAAVTVQQGQSASGNPYLFHGRRWDPETGLYYFRNRVYSPVLGRFFQTDPANYADSFNLYEFEAARTTTLIDPRGLGSEHPLPPSVPPLDLENLNVACGQALLPWYERWIRHCELDWPRHKREEREWTYYPVWKDDDTTRKMDNGRPCNEVTAAEIQECLRRNPYSPGTNKWGNNCQTSVIRSIALCCLCSDWDPNIYAGPERGKCLEWGLAISECGVLEIEIACVKWEYPDWTHCKSRPPKRAPKGSAGGATGGW